MVGDIPKYYWYQQGGFVMAVDAMSQQDAAKTVRARNGEAKYVGHFPASSFPKTACGIISDARQEQIENRNRHWRGE